MPKTLLHSNNTAEIDEESLLEAVDVSRTFALGQSEVHALQNISLSIEPGTFTTIMGPSGSGKSTLLQCLSTLDMPTSGHVQFKRQNTGRLSDGKLAALRRKHMGFVFQSYNLVDVLTVRQNIELPARLSGRRVSAARLHAVCEQLEIADRLGHLPSQLSGGQQQRVAIARAMVLSPEVVFADEPTGALDVRTGRQVLEILRTCTDQGQTVVMVTHDLNAARISDRVVLLIDGRVARDVASPSPGQWDEIRDSLIERG